MTCQSFFFKKKKWPVRLPFFYHIRYFLSCLSSCVPWTKQATSGVLIWVFIFLRSKLSPLAIGAHIIPVWIRFIPAQDCLADLYYCTVHACAATVLLSALTLLRLLTATYGTSFLFSSRTAFTIRAVQRPRLVPKIKIPNFFSGTCMET